MHHILRCVYMYSSCVTCVYVVVIVQLFCFHDHVYIQIIACTDSTYMYMKTLVRSDKKCTSPMSEDSCFHLLTLYSLA